MAYTETARKKFRSLIGRIAGIVTFTLPNINATTTNSDTFKVPGARVGDVIVVTPLSIADGLFVVGAEITSINTVTLKIRNITGSTVNGASTKFGFVVTKA